MANNNNLYNIHRTALPRDTKKEIGSHKPENFALLFNRMGHFAKKEELRQELEIDKLLSQEVKFHFFHKTRDSKIKQDYLLDLTMEWSLSNAQKEGYKKFHNEYAKAIQSLCPGIEPFSLKADWRIALGMGNASVYENGFTFHPTYGIPYLPGSSLKGMTRHWAKAEVEVKVKAGDYLKIFGNEQAESEDFQQGQIIFFDALPTQLSQDMVQPDIMNNHYPDYYEGNKPPADWLSPRPIFFLTMKGVTFQFHLGYIPRAGEEQDEQLLKTAEQWLKCAMRDAGIGAKTAVGYGRMRDKEDTYVPPEEPEEKREAQFKEGPKGKKLTNRDEFEAIVTQSDKKGCVATVFGYGDNKYEGIMLSGSVSTLKVDDVVKVKIQPNGKKGTKINSATFNGYAK